MASKVVVHFEAPNGDELQVEVDPNLVQGVIMLDGEKRKAFIEQNKLTNKPSFPPGLLIKDKEGKDVTPKFKSAAFGPGVCYMVGFEVFCW